MDLWNGAAWPVVGGDIYRGTGGRNIIGSIEPNMSDINDTSLYIKSFNDLNFYAGLGSISLGGNGPIKTFSTGMNFYSAGLFVNYYGGGVGSRTLVFAAQVCGHPGLERRLVFHSFFGL